MRVSWHPQTSVKKAIISFMLLCISCGSFANPQTSLALLDGEILFGTGAFELTTRGRQMLVSLVKQLDQFDQIISIRIIGHTDNVGSIEINQELSERRANWIKQNFVSRYPQTHILTIGAGESSPVVSNATREGRARNRRVEIQIIATGKSPE